MGRPIEEIRLIALSGAAHRTVCGLVQPSEEIDPAEIYADEEVWEEIRSAFPTAEARPGDEEASAPARRPSLETAPIMVLADGETFSPLAGCRAYEVPAGWGTEEIEAALAEGRIQAGEPRE